MGDQRLSHMNYNEMLAHRSKEFGDKLSIDEKKEERESVTWLLSHDCQDNFSFQLILRHGLRSIDHNSSLPKSEYFLSPPVFTMPYSPGPSWWSASFKAHQKSSHDGSNMLVPTISSGGYGLGSFGVTCQSGGMA